jgi:hypothetical protein
MQKMPILLPSSVSFGQLRYNNLNMPILQVKGRKQHFYKHSSTSFWQKMVQKHEISKTFVVPHRKINQKTQNLKIIMQIAIRNRVPAKVFEDGEKKQRG